MPIHFYQYFLFQFIIGHLYLWFSLASRFLSLRIANWLYFYLICLWTHSIVFTFSRVWILIWEIEDQILIVSWRNASHSLTGNFVLILDFMLFASSLVFVFRNPRFDFCLISFFRFICFDNLLLVVNFLCFFNPCLISFKALYCYC